MASPSPDLALLDRIPHAVLVHDGARYLYASAEAARLLGFSDPEDIVGRPVLESVASQPRWTPEKRPFVDGSKPAISGAG